MQAIHKLHRLCFLIHFFAKAKKKASREFKSLPADHPDRLKYGVEAHPTDTSTSSPVASIYHFLSQREGSGDSTGVVAIRTAQPSVPPLSYRQGFPLENSYFAPQVHSTAPPPLREYSPPRVDYPLFLGPSAPPMRVTNETHSKYLDDSPPYSEIEKLGFNS
nr:uncharacterized protein LOC113818379 [Penaeus vannamei]